MTCTKTKRDPSRNCVACVKVIRDRLIDAGFVIHRTIPGRTQGSSTIARKGHVKIILESTGGYSNPHSPDLAIWSKTAAGGWEYQHTARGVVEALERARRVKRIKVVKNSADLPGPSKFTNREYEIDEGCVYPLSTLTSASIVCLVRIEDDCNVVTDIAKPGSKPWFLVGEGNNCIITDGTGWYPVKSRRKENGDTVYRLVLNQKRAYGCIDRLYVADQRLILKAIKLFMNEMIGKR